MGIRVENLKVVYESVTMAAIEPNYLSITREQIEEYIKTHPYPDDSAYSVEDMIGDVTQSSGIYTLPRDTKDETDDWIADMLQELI